MMQEIYEWLFISYIDIMKTIITTMIRPKLEYAEVTWFPHKKKHVLKLERIQRIAIKMAPELEDLTYEERLIKCT